MESKIEKLPQSRVKVSIKANPSDLAHAAEHALAHTTSGVAVKGFRPGKAPKPLMVQQVGKGRILSELVDHALPEMLQQVANDNKLLLIETPAYALEKLCELNDDGTVKEDSTLEFSAEADVAPDVTVSDYKKIKIKPAQAEEITDKMIDDVVGQLADHRAKFEKVDRPAKKDDKVEIDFAGKRNGIPEERLASKHYPCIIGAGAMIPGFEDELIGKEAGDKHTFEITFPKDYHAKDLAGEKVVFDITVHEVSEKKMPDLNDEFAKQFGQESLAKLREAIKEEESFRLASQAKEKDEAAVLEAFLPLITVEVPKSLIEREIDRQLDIMRNQAQSYGLSFDHYLQHIKKTEEELRIEVRETAEKAVKIGLGLGEVVKNEGLDKSENPGVEAIAKLVEIATTSKK
jgi:trigger factor